MNTKEIAEWLREAARVEKVHAENYKSIGAAILHDGAIERAEMFESRAAQVEAMNCYGCRWWNSEGHACVHDKNKMWVSAEEKQFSVNWCGPKFGCVHWSKKPQDGRGEG